MTAPIIPRGTPPGSFLPAAARKSQTAAFRIGASQIGASHTGDSRTGGYLAIKRRGGIARAPSPRGLARRRWFITATKYLLPAAAALLLASIALWPEFERATDKARIIMTGMGASVEGGRVRDAQYHGVDEHNRPFTVTAESGSQRYQDRIDLTTPNADMALENGTWINVRSKQGVYTRKDGVLDLSDSVVLYRDDGTTMTTSAATVDTKTSAVSGDQATHVEGPFGTLDAAGFTTVDKGAAVQFWGPAHVTLNGVSR